jgi:hypothetical protein
MVTEAFTSVFDASKGEAAGATGILTTFNCHSVVVAGDLSNDG